MAAAADAAWREGLALHRQGRLDEARVRYERVLALDPGHFEALSLLGGLLAQSGQAEGGAALLRRATQVRPRAPQAHCMLGSVLSGLDRPAEALESYDAAIARRPGHAEARLNRATGLLDLRRPGEALEALDDVLAQRRDYPDALVNRGLVLLDLGRLEEALASVAEAIALRPGHAEAHFNHGRILDALDRFEEAIGAYEAAIALRPDFPEALINRALALSELHRLDETEAALDKVVAAAPQHAYARFNRGVFRLLAGRLTEGWPDYEHRNVRFGVPLDRGRPWRGDADLKGARLWVVHEQGLGDSIQCARYFKLLEGTGAEVVAQVQPALKPLLQQLSPSLRFAEEGETPEEGDFTCPMMSLPLAFGATLKTIPFASGYLQVDPQARAHMEQRLGPRARRRIALVWSGNPAHGKDRTRSIPFDDLRPLLDTGAHWFALQNEIRERDVAAFEEDGRVRFLGPELKDFGDAAALVEAMDVVVTIDTSLAHLAGALGKPVWILLPYTPDWRWMLGRADSPWYASARLFRQTRRGDWGSVLSEVRAALG